jgi:hypothetical protein
VEFAAKWDDGTYIDRWPNPFHAVLVSTWVLGIAGIHYLDNMAASALADVRPALNASDAEIADLHYKLTTLPALPTLLWSLGIIAFSIPTSLVTLIMDEVLQREISIWTSPLSIGLETVAMIFLYAVGGVFFYHTYRQLSLVSHIYSRLTNINMLHLEPLHAFSRLTALTAVMIVVSFWVWIATAPGLLDTVNPAGVAMTLSSLVLALSTFLVPLLGIHRILAARKVAMLAESSHRLQVAMDELDRRMDAGQIEGMDQMRHALEALVMKQRVIEGISTWPWSVETPRLVGTAILLPILLFVIQRIVGVVFGI